MRAVFLLALLASCSSIEQYNASKRLKEVGGCPYCPQCELLQKMHECVPIVKKVRDFCVVSSSHGCRNACTELFDSECSDCAQWDQQVMCERTGG
jgi:hypothetical protein